MATEKSTPEWLTADYMQSILQKSFENPQLTVKQIEIKPASSDGLNYVSQVLRVTADVANTKSDKISVIAKIKLNTQFSVAFSDGQIDGFQVEVDYFQKTLPQILTHLKENFAPKCYQYDKERQVLFLEDLCEDNYVSTPVQTFLTKVECQMALEALAAMHGASYYVLKENPNLKSHYPKSLICGEPNIFFSRLFSNAEVMLKQLAPSYGLNENLLKKLLHFNERYKADNGKVGQLSEDRLNFLIHCDGSKNNLLYRYKQGLVDSVKILDFQTISYNCFANDVQFLIFGSGQADVVVSHIDELLEVYFEKLLTVAPDIPNLTLKRIKSEFAERYYYGYLMTIGFRGVLHSNGPANFESILNGNNEELGFGNPNFASDMRIFLPFFEKMGVL